MDAVVKTLRSILNTTKNGLSEMQLHNIYREMEGKDIPHREYHFKTLYDFLYASNEFHLFSSRDELYIRARPKHHSKHIVNMVSEQRMKNTKFQKPRRCQITNVAGNQSQKSRLGQNMKSPKNQQKWNSVAKAKIKTANRMNMAREFKQNRKINGNQVQTSKHNQPIMISQNKTNAVHFWLRSFFKQVRFLLKQIASNAIIYDQNHVECFNEMAKIGVWKEIAHDYRGLSAQNDSTEDAEHSTENGSSLKHMQTLVQDELNSFVKKLYYLNSKYGQHSDRLNYSEIYYAMDTAEQAEISDQALIDIMQNFAFILESIVANPALYEHNNQLHHNESTKFSIWNHICTVYYEKLQSNDFELSDEDVHFELKYFQRTIERHLDRLTKPLTLSIVAK